MNKFEKLCQTASDIDVDIVDYPFTSDRFKGLYCDGTIALNQDICADSEKACILAEELGHHFTTVGNITDQKETENRKQERRARVWAYNEMISLSDLVDSYKDGCRSRYEIAEHLGVTEEFLQECLDYFHEKYGFKEAAHFHECGYKFDQWLDVVYLEKRLDKTTEPFIPFKELC